MSIKHAQAHIAFVRVGQHSAPSSLGVYHDERLRSNRSGYPRVSSSESADCKQEDQKHSYGSTNDLDRADLAFQSVNPISEIVT